MFDWVLNRFIYNGQMTHEKMYPCRTRKVFFLCHVFNKLNKQCGRERGAFATQTSKIEIFAKKVSD